MTAAIASSLSTSTPRLSTAISALFEALSRGAKADDVLDCRAHAGPSYLGPKSLNLRVHQIAPGRIPAPLVERLEADSISWRVGIAMRNGGGVKLATLSALIATFHVERVFRNPRNHERPYGKQWCWPEEAIAATVSRVTSTLPPSIVADGRNEIVAVWALNSPLDVSRAAGETQALDLLRRLAGVVGAVVPADDARLGDLAVLVPGFPIPNSPPEANAEVTSCPIAEPRVYVLEQIEEALGRPIVAGDVPRVEHSAAPRQRGKKETT